MTRISSKMVERRIDDLNRLFGFNGTDYRSVGSFQMGAAYGGYRLEKIVNESRGITVVSQDGYNTLRLLDSFVTGMIRGKSE